MKVQLFALLTIIGAWLVAMFLAGCSTNPTPGYSSSAQSIRLNIPPTMPPKGMTVFAMKERVTLLNLQHEFNMQANANFREMMEVYPPNLWQMQSSEGPNRGLLGATIVGAGLAGGGAAVEHFLGH